MHRARRRSVGRFSDLRWASVCSRFGNQSGIGTAFRSKDRCVRSDSTDTGRSIIVTPNAFRRIARLVASVGRSIAERFAAATIALQKGR